MPGEDQAKQREEEKLFVYANRVTGQVSWTVPPALSWKFVMHQDQHRAMWYVHLLLYYILLFLSANEVRRPGETRKKWPNDWKKSQGMLTDLTCVCDLI